MSRLLFLERAELELWRVKADSMIVLCALPSHLMSDPKARKVLIVDSLMLSTRIKTMIARVLFANLRVSLVFI